jgi:hypothetical protein
LWLLLGLRRKLNGFNAVTGAAGFLAGYAPAILFNLTHHFSNWREVFVSKAGVGTWLALFHPGTLAEIFLREMPKFFGPDTVLWYYPETPLFGVMSYLVAVLAVGVVAWPFLKSPAKIVPMLRKQLPDDGKQKDLLMLVLTAACFIPYLAAPIRVPGYFLGGCFFLSILTARLVERCLAVPAALPRLLGGTLLCIILIAGVSALIQTSTRNQIETLTLSQDDKSFHLTRIPGRDLDAVERYLRQNHIDSVWTTVSFVYPLIFESDEKLAASGAIFGWNHRVYPATVPWRQPNLTQNPVFVLESDSPFRSRVEADCQQATGAKPLVTDCGTLTVIEEVTQPVPSSTPGH